MDWDVLTTAVRLIDSWLQRWLHSARRARRRLGSGTQFNLDFSSREATRAIFEEGHGSLLTDGTRACMESSHLEYGVILDQATGERGLRIKMDDHPTCGNGAEIAVGHLASWATFSYGDFEWRARIHHTPDGSAPPANSFTCLSTFVHGSLTHNELAWCFPANDGREVHMAWWYDDTMHRTAKRYRTDLTQGLHNYTIRWRDVGMDWLIDAELVHQIRGMAERTVPWEPMSIRVILRPKNVPSVFLGAAHLELARVSYESAYSSASVESLRQAPPARVMPPPPPPPARSPPPPQPPHRFASPPPPSSSSSKVRASCRRRHCRRRLSRGGRRRG